MKQVYLLKFISGPDMEHKRKKVTSTHQLGLKKGEIKGNHRCESITIG